MTENEPQHPEVDDLGLTSEDWQDLQNRLHLRHDRTRSRDGRSRSVPPDGAYARSEVERIAAAEEADEAWRASRPGRAPQAEPEREAGQ